MDRWPNVKSQMKSAFRPKIWAHIADGLSLLAMKRGQNGGRIAGAGAAFRSLSRVILLLIICAGCASSGARKGSTPPASGEITMSSTSLSPAERERAEQYMGLVEEAARKYRVDPTLVLAVIWVESRFDRDARSSAGARGLMQLMPPTARGLARELNWRPRSYYDEKFNVHGGTYLLAQNLKRFKGDTKLALAAYNAGPSAVKRWQRERGRLPTSVQGYVDKVLVAQTYFAANSRAKNLQASPPASEPRKRNAGSMIDAAQATSIAEPKPAPTRNARPRSQTRSNSAEPTKRQKRSKSRSGTTATPSVRDSTGNELPDVDSDARQRNT
jgi:hypothetical protein